MTRFGQVVGIIVAMLGLWIALWGAYVVFQLMLGSTPPWQAGDPVVMTIWTGIAFVRVFGTLLFGLGAVLWAAQLRRNRERAVRVSICVTALLAALVALAQQVAIWRGTFGYVLIGSLILIAVVSVGGFVAPRENDVRRGVA